MTKHRHLFTNRQLKALAAFGDLVREGHERLIRDAQEAGFPNDRRSLAEGGMGATAYADGVATYLAFGVSRSSNTLCTLARWTADREQTVTAFSRQALPMTWDFPEVNPLAGAAGDIGVSIATIAKCTALLPGQTPGTVEQLDATALSRCEEDAVISTDPPYYDNVPYADLSDYFYVWLRRSLAKVHPQLLSTVLVPKSQELVAEPFRHGGKDAARAFFERGINRVFVQMRQAGAPGYPTTIYYAFKQAEEDEDADNESDESTASRSSTGWETFLQGLADAGWQVNGTWPMRTELGNRMRNQASNALASSIVLVCRPRPADAPLATRKEFMSSLRRELPGALKDLQHGNIAPVDLAQAAIGPGMAVFTRYSKVMETDGSTMTVRTALGIINQVLDEVLAEQEGEFDADTRWALAWFEQFGMEEGPFGVAEILSKAKNTSVTGLVEAGFLHSRSGKVRLLRREELDADWDPTTDKRLTVWEIAQHLIRTQQQAGELAAAALMHKVGGMAETARDLAYRLYSICERKKWADEALAYNGLVIAWPELTKLAIAERSKPTRKQSAMF